MDPAFIDPRRRWIGVVSREIVNCRRCPLSKQPGIRPVPPSGPVPARISIVGEAPGTDENDQRKPFVGRSGRLLRKELRRAGIDPDECFFTNSAMCFPGGSPADRTLRQCYIHLRRTLKVADSPFVLLLGRIALQRIKPGASITRWRGRPIKGKNRLWMPTYHPAYVLRCGEDGEEAEAFREDLARFAELASAGA